MLQNLVLKSMSLLRGLVPLPTEALAHILSRGEGGGQACERVARVLRRVLVTCCERSREHKRVMECQNA